MVTQVMQVPQVTQVTLELMGMLTLLLLVIQELLVTLEQAIIQEMLELLGTQGLLVIQALQHQ